MRKMITPLMMAAVVLVGAFAHAALNDNGNGTVTDSRTGLIWQQDEPGVMAWSPALSYCEELDLGGSTSWRLPNVKELESLLDDTRYNPAIDPSMFPNAFALGYWSSTTYATYPSGAWHVSFAKGYVGSYAKNNALNARCVRGGHHNAVPIASDQALNTPENLAKPVTLIAVDADGDPLTYMVDTPPAHGIVIGDMPDLSYQPSADFIGSDSFTFKANDGWLDSNIATVRITVTADTTRPTGSISINNGAASTNTASVTITISAIDTGGSGLDTMRFANGGGTTTDWEPCQTTKPWTLSGVSGAKIVYLQLKDKAGNISDADPIKAGAQSYQASIIYDVVRPTGSMLINGGTTSTNSTTVTLNLSANDTGGSGLDAMRFVNSGGTTTAWEPYQTIKFWTLSSGNGTKIVYVQFKDKAGNISDADPGKAGAQSYQASIIYDAVRPTGSMLINNGAASTDSVTATLNLSAVDTGGSGLDAMRFVNSGGAVSDWEPYQPTKFWTLTSGGGTKTVYTQFRDRAGNISDADPIKVGAQSYSDTIIFSRP